MDQLTVEMVDLGYGQWIAKLTAADGTVIRMRSVTGMWEESEARAFATAWFVEKGEMA